MNKSFQNFPKSVHQEVSPAQLLGPGLALTMIVASLKYPFLRSKHTGDRMMKSPKFVQNIESGTDSK